MNTPEYTPEQLREEMSDAEWAMCLASILRACRKHVEAARTNGHLLFNVDDLLRGYYDAHPEPVSVQEWGTAKVKVRAHAAALEELAKQSKWETRCNQEFARAERLEVELAAVKAELTSAQLKHKEDAAQVVALMHERDEARSALAQAERRGMERAAESLRMTNGEILLMAGEMSAGELRAVKAVMESKRMSILAAAGAR